MMGNDLIELVQKSKIDNDALLTLINYFEPKLNKCLYQTQQHYREDLRQDLLIKLIHVIRKYDVQATPGFWDMKKQFSK